MRRSNVVSVRLGQVWIAPVFYYLLFVLVTVVTARKSFNLGQLDKDKFERGGLFSDGLELDFSKVFDGHHDNAELPHPTATSDHISISTTQLKKFTQLEKKLAEIEANLAATTRNLEILQQNTQVISKGFNILSGRVNEVSKEQERASERMQNGNLFLESRIEEIRKEHNSSLTEHSIRSAHEIESLKEKDRQIFEVQLSHEHKFQSEVRTVRDSLDKMTDASDNKTATMAEMVKKLAEISKLEKDKLKNLTEYTMGEMSRLDDMCRQESSSTETVAHKIRNLSQELAALAQKHANDSEIMKSKVKNFAEFYDDQLKRIDDGILEQNMAHNLAHDNIMERLDGVKFNNASDVDRLFYKVEKIENNLHQAGLKDADMTMDAIKNWVKEFADMQVKLDAIEKRVEDDDSSDTTQLPSSKSDLSLSTKAELELIKDRIGTFEENIAELWRSHKEIASAQDKHSDTVGSVQASQKSDHDSVNVKLMEFKVATKMLSEIVRNMSRDFVTFEKQIEDEKAAMNKKVQANAKALTMLKDQVTSTEQNVSDLWSKSKNISDAQELFLLKLLEVNEEHNANNHTMVEEVAKAKAVTSRFTIMEQLVNKSMHQFGMLDAEQSKTREEMLNIKDRLVFTEENIKEMWKHNKNLQRAQEDTSETLENILLVHKSDNKNVSMDLLQAKRQLENVTSEFAILGKRLNDIELRVESVGSLGYADIQSKSKNSTAMHSGITSLEALKAKVRHNENDISELWKSSEILSFQQQTFNEKLKSLQTVHNNDTHLAATEVMKTKFETQNLFQMFGNMTNRISGIEKLVGPPHESRTIDFEIKNWKASLANGLKNQAVMFEAGKLLGVQSTWKASVELAGKQLSLYYTLLKADQPVYNEFSVDVLDADGRTFATYGPDLHLFTVKERIGWPDLLTLDVVNNQMNKLVRHDVLKLRLRMRVYGKPTPDENENMPVEKQLIYWEVRNLAAKVSQSIPPQTSFLDLNLTKEFQAGHFWGGSTKWKLSLLTREINGMKYLGINMELIDMEHEWKELVASYNVTMSDTLGKPVKEFAIASNDFKQVSARHSYFMLVQDLQEILRKSGDMLTFRVYFDLQARKSLYDVEIIR